VTIEELARRFLSALATGDSAGAVALSHPDLELRIPTAPPGVPKLVTGHAELAALASKIGLTWTGVTLEMDRVDAFATDAARGVAQFRVIATNLDGSHYRNTYISLIELADGLIHRWTEYYDPEPMVAAINALRARVRAGSPSSG
jgi:ketosteroid isomerase-like protein